MITYLFGYSPASNLSSNVESNRIDLINTPYSPLQPGRFNVLRDFHIVLNPGA